MAKNRTVVRFEDAKGNRLDLVLIGSDTKFRTFARHIKRKIVKREVSEGATTYHTNEKAAMNVLADMIKEAKSRGWELRLPKHKDEPVKMEVLPDGTRVFRGRDGKEIIDHSSSNPPVVKTPDTTPPKKEPKKQKEEFSMDSLPKP